MASASLAGLASGGTLLIGGIADHERDALFGEGRLAENPDRQNGQNDG